MAGCGPKDIYDALIKAGASTGQAVGIMANMINESSLNVETGAGGKTIDSNGYPVYGLVSWNTASYPDAATLVTGDCAQDLKAQVNYLARTGGFTAADPSGNSLSGTEAAGSFAANYERCQGCQPGGAQYAARSANAATIDGWISSGKWPKSPGKATSPGGGGPGAGPSSGSSGSGGPCLWQLGGGSIGPVGLPSACVFSKSQGRALVGGLVLAAGGAVMALGVILLVAVALKRTGVAQTVISLTPAGRAGGVAAKLTRKAAAKP